MGNYNSNSSNEKCSSEDHCNGMKEKTTSLCNDVKEAKSNHLVEHSRIAFAPELFTDDYFCELYSSPPNHKVFVSTKVRGNLRSYFCKHSNCQFEAKLNANAKTGEWRVNKASKLHHGEVDNLTAPNYDVIKKPNKKQKLESMDLKSQLIDLHGRIEFLERRGYILDVVKKKTIDDVLNKLELGNERISTGRNLWTSTAY